MPGILTTGNELSDSPTDANDWLNFILSGLKCLLCPNPTEENPKVHSPNNFMMNIMNNTGSFVIEIGLDLIRNSTKFAIG